VTASTDQHESADGLRTFLGAYGGASNTNDVDAIGNAYATPCFVVKSGQVLRHNDDAAKRRYFPELHPTTRRAHIPGAWAT
jgi:hypothetical protein